MKCKSVAVIIKSVDMFFPMPVKCWCFFGTELKPFTAVLTSTVLFFPTLRYKGKMFDLLKTIIAISFNLRYGLFLFPPLHAILIDKIFVPQNVISEGWGSL